MKELTEDEFKAIIANGILRISVSLNSTMDEISSSLLTKMVDEIVNRIEEYGFDKNVNLYKNAISKILKGEIPFYKLNILALMEAFYIEINGKPARYASDEELEERRYQERKRKGQNERDAIAKRNEER